MGRRATREPAAYTASRDRQQKIANSRIDEDSLTHSSVKTPARVSVDQEVMGGAPCFIGTRVPTAMVLGRFDSGESWGQLPSDHPFPTAAHIRAARASAARPEAGMPGGSAPADTASSAPAAASTAPHRPKLVTGGAIVKTRRLVRGPRRETRDGEDAARRGKAPQGRG